MVQKATAPELFVTTGIKSYGSKSNCSRVVCYYWIKKLWFKNLKELIYLWYKFLPQSLILLFCLYTFFLHLEYRSASCRLLNLWGVSHSGPPKLNHQKYIKHMDILNSKWIAFSGFPCWWRLQVLAPRASILGMVSFTRLDGRNDIQSVKSSWSVIHAELKARMLPNLQGYNKGCKTNTQISMNVIYMVCAVFKETDIQLLFTQDKLQIQKPN